MGRHEYPAQPAIGLPDRFIECGAVATLQAAYGLTTAAVVATLERLG